MSGKKASIYPGYIPTCIKPTNVLHIHIYIHMHIYMHTYIHTYIHRYIYDMEQVIKYIQGGSNMTGTDLYVNKPHCAAAVRP